MGRNELCSCGSGKKFKKCCGVQKKMSQREASVISSTTASSLLDRITGGRRTGQESDFSLRDRISKISTQTVEKKDK